MEEGGGYRVKEVGSGGRREGRLVGGERQKVYNVGRWKMVRTGYMGCKKV